MRLVDARAQVPGDRIMGIDTSVFQGVLDIEAIMAAGVEFAFHKATDGERGVDGQWSRSAAASSLHGLPFGAYGVLHPSQDARRQAEHFVGVVRDSGFSLAPMLDFELAYGVTALHALEDARAWLDIVEEAFGLEAIVYTGPSFIRQLAQLSGTAGAAELAAISQRMLFVAHYTQDHLRLPSVPPPWEDWTLWQSSGSYKDGHGKIVCVNACQLPGTSTDVDVDWYRGTIDELLALGLPAVAAPVNPAKQAPA